MRRWWSIVVLLGLVWTSASMVPLSAAMARGCGETLAVVNLPEIGSQERWRHTDSEAGHLDVLGVAGTTVVVSAALPGCAYTPLAVMGFDRDSGQIAWRFDDADLPGTRLNPPALAGGMVLFSERDFNRGTHWLAAVDPASGELAWVNETLTSDASVSFPAATDSTLVVIENLYGPISSGNLVGIDLMSGNEVWRMPAGGVVERLELDASTGMAAALVHDPTTARDQNLPITTGDRTVLAFDSNSGEPTWTFSDPPSRRNDDRDHSYSLHGTDDGFLYTAQAGSQIVNAAMLHAPSGRRLWIEDIAPVVAVADDQIVTRIWDQVSTSSVAVLDAETAEPVWEASFDGLFVQALLTDDVLAVPVVSPDDIVDGRYPSNLLIGFDRETGQELWRSEQLAAETGVTGAAKLMGHDDALVWSEGYLEGPAGNELAMMPTVTGVSLDDGLTAWSQLFPEFAAIQSVQIMDDTIFVVGINETETILVALDAG